MHYTVTATDGDSVQVDAPNWMMAMSKAMAFMDIDPDSMGRWVCDPQDGGAVNVTDPASRRVWLVTPTGEAGAVARAGGGPTLEPSPMKLPQVEAPDDLAERLFEGSFDITGQTPNVACTTALALINEFVPCEASSVLRGTINDVALTFVAVNGPVADNILGRKLPWGTGLVGTCFDLGIPLVTTVGSNEEHLKKVDSESGFTTKAVLCMPVRNDTGTFGVIQLLNPPSGQFADWHIETVETVSRTLAGALSTLQEF